MARIASLSLKYIILFNLGIFSFEFDKVVTFNVFPGACIFVPSSYFHLVLIIILC